MRVFATILALGAVGLGGCGTALPGKIYARDDATVLTFEIERSYGTGEMRATNPKTGEKFEGQYTATPSNGGFSQGTATNWQTGQTATVQTFAAPSKGSGRGVLIGDQGTVIEMYLDIKPGIRPKGHGEGRDNPGRRYQVQF